MMSFVAIRLSLLALCSPLQLSTIPSSSPLVPTMILPGDTAFHPVETKATSVFFDALNVTEDSPMGNWINFATTTPVASPLAMPADGIPAAFDHLPMESCTFLPTGMFSCRPPVALFGGFSPIRKQTRKTYDRLDSPTTFLYGLESLEEFWKQTQTTFDRLPDPTTFVTHILNSLQSAIAKLFPSIISTKKTTLLGLLADWMDPRYNEYGSEEYIDPCVLHGFHLGLPYGMVATRFWNTPYVPTCIPTEPITSSTSFFQSPIRFLVDFYTSGTPNQQTAISRKELDDAISQWIQDELDAIWTTIALDFTQFMLWGLFAIASASFLMIALSFLIAALSLAFFLLKTLLYVIGYAAVSICRFLYSCFARCRKRAISPGDCQSVNAKQTPMRLFHVGTHQGKTNLHSTNACSVIATVVASFHINDQKKARLDSDTLKHIIDDLSGPLAHAIREQNGVEELGLLEQSYVNEYLTYGVSMFDKDQAKAPEPIGGNALAEEDLRRLCIMLDGGPERPNIKAAASFYFLNHVIAILRCLNKETGDYWFEVIDSLPCNNGSALHCHLPNIESLESFLRSYCNRKLPLDGLDAGSMFNPMDTDDPRLFQAFIWTE